MTSPSQQKTTQQKTVESSGDEALLDRILEAQTDRMDRVAHNYAEALDRETLPLRKAMLQADAILKLQQLMTEPIMQRFMRLMNNPLGFKTDRAKGKDPYPPDVVRDCIIQGLLRGAYPVGNEINIIAGQCYLTKECYERKVRELPGLTDLKTTLGVPRFVEGRMLVRGQATWRLNGVQDQLISGDDKPGRTFPIITHEGTSADNILGKATRKLLKAVYDQCTGSKQGDPDDIPDLGAASDAPTAASDLPTGRTEHRRPRGNGQTAATAKEPEAPAETPPEPASPPSPDPGPESQPTAADPVPETDPRRDPVAESGLDQDELALADLLSDLHDAIATASTREAMTEIGKRLTQNRDWLGEPKYQELVRLYQTRYREISGGTTRR
jgi:hypothetical protein